YSRGAVAAVHATWENNCGACHLDFQPIRGDTWASGLLASNNKEVSHQCQACHTGPPHHPGDSAEESRACAGCHRAHRGPSASLIGGFDSDCTQCHASLASDAVAGPKGYKNVTRFDRDHPDFVSLERDPGNLKFNHALHMTPGILKDARKPFKLNDI